MAVIKATKGGKTLAGALNYVDRKAVITSGKDCADSKAQAYEQMQATKELWDKTEGRQHLHYIQSFEPGEVTPEKAHEIGREWAAENFPEHEVFMATHIDKEHIHTHFVVNSVNYENGHKIQVSPKDLERFKDRSDEICKEYGLSTIDRTQKREESQIRAYAMEKYKMLERAGRGEVKSFILNTAIAVDIAIEKASNKQEFVQIMKEQNYKVEWQDHKKHITYTDKEGHKVRAANLEKTFSNSKFSKEGMEYEFSRSQEERIKQQPEPTRENEHRRDGEDSNREQSSIEGTRQFRESGTQQNGKHLTDQSLGSIARELRDLKERTGFTNQTDREQSKSSTREQQDHERHHKGRSR